MLIGRRAALLGGIAIGSGAAVAAPVSDRDEIFRLLFWEGVLGPNDPLPDDPLWDEARALIDAAPRHVPPYRVAAYFAEGIPAKFRRAWTEQKLANPVIVDLWTDMKMGRSRPGDTTAWCAAFVNWCLWRSGVPGTGSPRSQSFAGWGTPVWTRGDGVENLRQAKPGDVAVFRNGSSPQTGHVGFFTGMTANRQGRVDILGGNQSQQSRIYTTSFPIVNDQYLLSVRTVRGLHDA